MSPIGLLRSALTTGANSRESYINVTWTPTASQLGPTICIFCYTATDNYRCVEKWFYGNFPLQHQFDDGISPFTLCRLASQQSCITLVVGGGLHCIMYYIIRSEYYSYISYTCTFVRVHTVCSGCSSASECHAD